MKFQTIVRLYWLALTVLVTGLAVNLYETLSTPTISWNNLHGLSLLALIAVTLVQLTNARKKLAADPSAVISLSGTRYLFAALLLAAAVAAVLLGIHVSR